MQDPAALKRFFADLPRLKAQAKAYSDSRRIVGIRENGQPVMQCDLDATSVTLTGDHLRRFPDPTTNRRVFST